MDMRRCFRFRRKVFVFSMMLFATLTVGFYALTFTCCSLLGPSLRARGSGMLTLSKPGYEKAGLPDRKFSRERYHQKNLLQNGDLTETTGIDGATDHRKTRKFTDKAGLGAVMNENPENVVGDDSGQVNRTSRPLRPLLPSRGPSSGTSSSYVRTYQNATRKLPQAIIIGVKKGGTRALLEFLRLHPQIRAAGQEVHFFDRFHHLGYDWYRRQMPPTLPSQITMEKSPSYFVTKEVPRLIYNMSKDIKLIVVVRDPVVRAISDYTQGSSKTANKKTFEEMAFLNTTTGLVDTSYGAIRVGVYAKHLERWLKYFTSQQMLFVSGEKLISDPAAVMKEVQEFLGIKNIINKNHFYFNETKGFPCVMKSEGSSTPHCLGKTKGRAHPNVEPKLLKRLRNFFRPFNAKFYQMVNKDFGWP